LLVAVAATLPSLAFVTANVLEHEIGVSGAATWLDPMLTAPAPSALLTIAITLGPLLSRRARDIVAPAVPCGA
jgi:hypothetical protein